MKRILVIGGVAAGLKAAAKARRCDSSAEITVVEKGEMISYGACGLPYYLSGDVAALEDLAKTPVGVVRNPEYFQNIKDITVMTETSATEIDRERKRVKIKHVITGEESILPYDKLVIATGATPIQPTIPGSDLKHIYQLWHPKEAAAIREGLDKRKFKQAVIIGAGLVGLEVAEALLTRGLDVTVIEMKDQVFPGFLDVEVAGVVEKYIAEEGLVFRGSEKVVGFEGKDGEVRAVVTDKGTIDADLVVLALGVRPNTELARAAGLEIGQTGAILVDTQLRTSDPDIYAGGDCVENVNIVSGKKVFAPMGSTANKHGRIIGENVCGGSIQFAGILNTVAVSVLGINVGKTGATERELKEMGIEYVATTVAGHDKPHYMPGAKIITTKLLVEAGSRRVLGAQIVGEGDVTKRIDVIATVLTAKGTVDMLFDIDLSYAPPFNSPIDNVAVAANTIMNKLAGSFHGISALAAKDKMAEDNAVFLDVRTPGECEQIRLAGCKNIMYIPLGQLRSRIAELPADKEIVAFCKISLRGYEAEAILRGNGLNDVSVLEGGIVAWPFDCDK